MRWWSRIDAALMGTTVPDRLGDRVADRHWTRFDDGTQLEWWSAWSGTVCADDPVPGQPWRAAVVAALVRRARPRRRATWIAALVTAFVGVTVISVGSPVPPDLGILVDTAPYSLSVILIAIWDEHRRSVFVRRCDQMAALGVADTTALPSPFGRPRVVQSGATAADR